MLFFTPLLVLQPRMPESRVEYFRVRALISLLTHSPNRLCGYTVNMSHTGRSERLLDPPNTGPVTQKASVFCQNTRKAQRVKKLREEYIWVPTFELEAHIYCFRTEKYRICRIVSTTGRVLLVKSSPCQPRCQNKVVDAALKVTRSSLHLGNILSGAVMYDRCAWGVFPHHTHHLMTHHTKVDHAHANTKHTRK